MGGQLVKEAKYKQMALPPCFDQWIDLKLLYKRHYKKEPRGGLQACFELSAPKSRDSLFLTTIPPRALGGEPSPP